jgi:hypothetical protein
MESFLNINKKCGSEEMDGKPKTSGKVVNNRNIGNMTIVI